MTGDSDMDAVLQPSTAAPSEDADMAAVLNKPGSQDAPNWLQSNLINPLGRAAYKAVSAAPLMAEDFLMAAKNVAGDAANKVLGNPATPDYELPSARVNRALDAWLAPPTTTAGKASEIVNTMILNAALPAFPRTPSGSAESGLTGAQRQAMIRGKSMGMQMTPGMETGSTVAKQAEARASSVPYLSGPFSAIQRNNQNVLNTAAARSIGESGNSVDASVLGAAADRLGDVFESVRSPDSVILTDPKTTSTILDAIDSTHAGLLPGSGSVRDNALVKSLESLAQSGSMTSEQVGNLSSKLGKAAYKQMTSAAGDRDLGQALYDVKNHADDILQSTLGGEDAAQYAAARQQYHTLMQLAKPGIVNSSTGDVAGANLANLLQRTDKGGYLFGRNQSDLYSAARFSQAFKPIVGDSGTATRSADLKDMALAVPGNIASWAYLHPLAPAVRTILDAPGGLQKVLKQGLDPSALSAILTGAAATEQFDSNPSPSQ
jgi:hypothetical protein